MQSNEAIDTGAYETLTTEVPDRLRNLIEQHLPSIRTILIQQKRDGNWRVLRQRIRGVASLDLDHVCERVVQIVQQHAEGSESDRTYRARIEIGSDDGSVSPRFAQIKAKVGADGDVDVQDGIENEERGNAMLIRDLMDHHRTRERELYAQTIDALKDMQEQARLTMQQTADNTRANSELVGQVTNIGESMQNMLVGVTGMLATGIELHSTHAQSQAEVQIKQMEFDAEAAKWSAGLGILGKIAAPLGGQIAASFGKGKKKGSVSQPAAAAVEGNSGAANVPAVVPSDDAPPAIEIVNPPDGWEVGRAAKAKAVMAELDDDQRKAITETMGDGILESFEDAAKSDASAAECLPVIRAGIERRLQENEYAQRMLMARLSGALGDDKTAKLFDLLPPAPEE